MASLREIARLCRDGILAVRKSIQSSYMVWEYVTMNLQWPWFLFLLVLIPLLVAVYIIVLRRRKRFTIRYSSLSLIRAALPQRSRWRRHLPFALFLLAMGSLTFALSKPITVLSIPTNRTTIILSMDVSRSMCSTDIKPNRLEVAQAAALSFIEAQKPGTLIGIVAFSGFAEIVQTPTSDKEALKNAVNNLVTGRRTAIGSGIMTAIDAIAEIDQDVAASIPENSRLHAPPPVVKGAYAPDIIVLLTDGASNAGITPLKAAQQAADRGLRVFTIGFGTANGGEFPNCSSQLIGREQGGITGPSGSFGGGGGYGGGPGGGGGFRRGIDEVTLKQVADNTGGTYYSAESASDLKSVFEGLPVSLITKHQTQEVSFAFAALGALLVALALGLSLLWNPLP